MGFLSGVVVGLLLGYVAFKRSESVGPVIDWVKEKVMSLWTAISSKLFKKEETTSTDTENKQ